MLQTGTLRGAAQVAVHCDESFKTNQNQRSVQRYPSNHSSNTLLQTCSRDEAAERRNQLIAAWREEGQSDEVRHSVQPA